MKKGKVPQNEDKEVRLEDLNPQELKQVATELAAMIRAQNSVQSEDDQSDL